MIVKPTYPTQASRWDAPLEFGPLMTPRGMAIPGRTGVFDAETGRYLGDYARGESVMRNVDLVGAVESAMTNRGLKFGRKITVLDGGSKMEARFVIQHDIAGPDGKSINPMLTLRNSYDRVWKILATIAAMRLSCFNGMFGFGDTFSLARRHSGLVTVESVAEIVIPQLEAGVQSIAQQTRLLSDVAVSMEEGQFLLRHLAGKSTKFPRLTARRIEEAWEKQTPDVAGQRNLWGLYNAGTALFSRKEEEATEKTEWAVATGQYWTLAMLRLASNATERKQFTVPVDYETAYGVEQN